MATPGNNKKIESARRKLLKAVMVGGGAITASKLMPEQWTRPVVASVMLPAHALTTNDTRLNCVSGPFGFPISQTLTVLGATLTNSEFNGTNSGGTFTITAAADNGGTPCVGSRVITYIGVPVGPFNGTLNLYCNGSLAGYCSATGNATAAGSFVTLTGSAYCTACTYLIGTTGP